MINCINGCRSRPIPRLTWESRDQKKKKKFLFGERVCWSRAEADSCCFGCTSLHADYLLPLFLFCFFLFFLLTWHIALNGTHSPLCLHSVSLSRPPSLPHSILLSHFQHIFNSPPLKGQGHICIHICVWAVKIVVRKRLLARTWRKTRLIIVKCELLVRCASALSDLAKCP